MMRHIFALLICSGVGYAAYGADLAITSLTSNGQLTWTNASANASYRVEWAGSLAGPWQPFSVLTNLDSIKTTNTTVTVNVPMFYRVVWVDAPPPQPAGDWVFEGYSSSGVLIASGLISLANSTNATPISGTWTFEASNSASPLRCSSGQAWSGSGANFPFSVYLDGCGFAEGVYGLEGTLVGDTYYGTWYDEGIVANPIGAFMARRQPTGP